MDWYYAPLANFFALPNLQRGQLGVLDAKSAKYLKFCTNSMIEALSFAGASEEVLGVVEEVYLPKSLREWDIQLVHHVDNSDPPFEGCLEPIKSILFPTPTSPNNLQYLVIRPNDDTAFFSFATVSAMKALAAAICHVGLQDICKDRGVILSIDKTREETKPSWYYRQL